MFRLNVNFFCSSFIEILNIDLVTNVASWKARDALVELEKNDTLKHKLKSCMHHKKNMLFKLHTVRFWNPELSVRKKYVSASSNTTSLHRPDSS